MRASKTLIVVWLVGCTHQQPPPTASPAICPAPAAATAAGAASSEATVAEATAFAERVERNLLRLWAKAERAAWIKQTYIIEDTAIVAARAQEEVMAYTARAAAESTRFDGLDLPRDVRRKIKLLKLSLSLPAPPDAERRAELARIATDLDATYGKGKVCSARLATAWRRLARAKRAPADNCLALGQLEQLMARSRDYDVLMETWQGWRAIARPMRKPFERYVELGNEGARSLGFADLGELWKSRYDMPPEAFEAEVDRLWGQVKPLYDDLHCYARTTLQQRYGKARVPDDGPLPAHLLGNMWSQEWAYLEDLLLPNPRVRRLDIARALRAKGVDEKEMVRYGERFFVSLGFDPLPKTFWRRSMFTKPRDRDVVCHASAWDVDYDHDLRIKMCIRINDEDFRTVHHELGHNYYYYSFRHQPTLYRDSANDGFNEAVGDTLSLSVTPPYLAKIGLLKRTPQDDLNLLMRRALDKVAFLPFGLLIDKWRWEVFAGKVQPADYNKRWWTLRRQYQGISPPVPRTAEDFDPGAKYHVPANVPYTRYFLASILQFQFHRALCKIAGHDGPLHTCSIYGNKEAGARLKGMLEMGLSQPWPEALEAITGERRMDASAILAYFAPLHEWLRAQNKGRSCSW
jgi:peptidyl-dipeptidase A